MTERLALQLIDDDAIQGISMIVVTSQNERIVSRGLEDMRQSARLGYFFGEGEMTIAIENLDTIICIPISNYQHATAIELDSSCRDSFLVKASKTQEFVHRRIVTLHRESLSDTQIIVESSCQQHLSRLQHNRKATIVGIDRLQQMPLTIFQIFSSRRRHETSGMATKQRELSIDEDRRMTTSRDVHIRQSLSLDSDHRATLLAADRVRRSDGCY